MRLLSFDPMPKAWMLQTRLAASAVVPLIFGVSAVIAIFAQPDRWNHAMGGAMLYCALSALWGTATDAITYQGAWKARNFQRRFREVS